MGFNDHIDCELYENIQHILDEGVLEEKTAAYGIAQQVIHRGYNSLTPKQRTLYDKVVVPALQIYGEELRILDIQNSNRD